MEEVDDRVAAFEAARATLLVAFDLTIMLGTASVYATLDRVHCKIGQGQEVGEVEVYAAHKVNAVQCRLRY